MLHKRHISTFLSFAFPNYSRMRLRWRIFDSSEFNSSFLSQTVVEAGIVPDIAQTIYLIKSIHAMGCIISYCTSLDNKGEVQVTFYASF